jgi:hypothetical protein
LDTFTLEACKYLMLGLPACTVFSDEHCGEVIDEMRMRAYIHRISRELHNSLVLVLHMKSGLPNDC